MAPSSGYMLPTPVWKSSYRLIFGEKAEPTLGTGIRGLIEAELKIDIDEARSVHGALEVAAHPIKAVGDARQHGGFAIVIHACNSSRV